MNISCGIIRDLLPLYCDQVCSDDSRQLVEEHLRTCSGCRDNLAKLREEPEASLPAPSDESPLKAIARGWRREQRKSFLRGTAVAAAVCLLLASSLWALTRIKDVPVPSRLLEASDVCRLQDGRIAFHLYVNDDRDLSVIETRVGEDGIYYLMPKRSVIEPRRVGAVGAFNRYFAVDPVADAVEGTELAAIYLGAGSDAVPVWEAGMDLPQASPHVEAQLAVPPGDGTGEPVFQQAGARPPGTAKKDDSLVQGIP